MRFLYPFLLLALAAVLAVGASRSQAYESAAARQSGFTTLAAGELPREGRDTLALIRKGGPFPYAKDGSTFSNREHYLPKQPRGYYREYTVKTPGSRDRGARRIICGGKLQLECYYTGDHYATFKIIKE